jgi:hypothetical protein
MSNISFAKEALNITICNQYPGLELIPPVYCSNGTACHVSPDQQAGSDNNIKASFGIDSKQKDFKCALLYKLQKKCATKTDSHLNSSAKFIKDTATNVYLLVIWDVGNDHCHWHVWLIEWDAGFTWDEDKLWALYRRYDNQVLKDCKSNIVTWLANESTVMKTRFDEIYRSDYKLNIVISEGIGSYDMKRSMKLDLRSVLSLLMLTLLIYAVRLPIRSSFKLNIHNQCSNVDLLFPTYITSYSSECYRAPDHKVCAGNTMRSCFIIGPGNKSDGALICKLQRKQSHKSTETSENASSVVQLLVVWRISESDKLYTDVLLVEYNKRFDKDNLRGLYHKNIDLLGLYPSPVIETWSLNDNVTLMPTSEIMRGTTARSFVLNITISEVKRDNSTRIPTHIDPER